MYKMEMPDVSKHKKKTDVTNASMPYGEDRRFVQQYFGFTQQDKRVGVQEKSVFLSVQEDTAPQNCVFTS